MEKIYTTVAALNLLGPSLELQTTVLGTGELEHGGVWRGNLYLRGGGDPTLGDGAWNQAYEHGYGPTALQLAMQLRRDGIRRVTGHIFADESLFDSDRGGPATKNLPDTPDYGGELSALVYDHGMSTARMPPAVFAAHELALTLRGMGDRVAAAGRTRVTPPGAAQLAVVSLAPAIRTREADGRPLRRSDRGHARQADRCSAARPGYARGRGDRDRRRRSTATTTCTRRSSTAPGWIGRTAPRPPRWSRLLRELWDTPIGSQLYAALPVVGEQGTVQNLALHTPAQNHCVAKTGTLEQRHQPGRVLPRHRRDTLAFALMIDGPANWQAVPMLSRVVAAVARY